METSPVCDRYDAFGAFELRCSQTRIPQCHALA